MRVIAGPNGSGKTTILDELESGWLGIYLNADDMQAGLATGGLDLPAYGLQEPDDILRSDLQAFLASSPILEKSASQRGTRASEIAKAVELDGGRLQVASQLVDAYLAAAVADFTRLRLIERGLSFTFETVMSSVEKVRLMLRAQAAGYRTYLYFVATASPEINIERVRLRVAQGGHDVPEHHVRQRYVRSIDLLADACFAANRSYIFDNSGVGHQLIAEVTDGVEMILHSDSIPPWLVQTRLWEAFHAAPC